MKRNITMAAIAIAALTITSCASKKDLANCQSENKSLTASLQSTREDLAGKNARITSLEEQLADLRKNNDELKRNNATLQKSLNQSRQNQSIV